MTAAAKSVAVLVAGSSNAGLGVGLSGGNSPPPPWSDAGQQGV